MWEAQKRWIRTPDLPALIFPQPSTTLMILSQVALLFPTQTHSLMPKHDPWSWGQVRTFPFLGSQTYSFPQMKLWRLPASGQALPSGPGLVLGPEDTRVEVLQFHPTVDGILVSTAGTAVKVWDVAKQQPLTGMGHTSRVTFWAGPPPPPRKRSLSLFMCLTS